MDIHRKEYKALRDAFIQWLDIMDARLGALDPGYFPTPGKRGVNRINNNLLFHPDRPVYKDHFGAGLDKAPGKGDFYVQIGIEQSLLAGGVWRPAPADLSRIREAIDYDGEILEEILLKPSFKKLFGTLYEDRPLKRMPKGYSADHPQADLLKNKTFAVIRPISKAVVLSKDFEDIVVETYMELLPFRTYLNRALSL